MNTNMTTDEIADAMKQHTTEVNGARPGRFVDQNGEMAQLFDGPEPDPNEAAHNEEEDAMRTDFSEDQQRDGHGRFAAGGVGLEGKTSTAGVGRPGGGAGPLHAKGEGGTAKGGGKVPKDGVLKVTPTVRSAIEVHHEGHDPSDTNHGELALKAAYADGHITVPHDEEQKNHLVSGLNDLSNHHDDLSREHSLAAEEQKFSKNASKQLGDLASKVRGTQGVPAVPPTITSVEPKEFHAAFEKQMKDSPYAAFVTHYTPEQLAAPDMKTFMNKEKTAGLAIHDHGDGRVEGTALFATDKAAKGTGQALLKDAVANHGVNYCECYAGTLNKFYEKIGFVEESRSPFNRDYAAPNWDYARFGTPDYVTMRFKGAAS